MGPLSGFQTDLKAPLENLLALLTPTTSSSLNFWGEAPWLNCPFLVGSDLSGAEHEP